MLRTIVITGSSGYVCRYLVETILSVTNYKIIVTYHSKKDDYKQNSRLFFEHADLNTPAVFDSIFSRYKPDYFVHLAAMARVKDGELKPLESIRVNLISSLYLVNLCMKFNVRSALFASSNLAQNPVSVVGISKFLIEQYIQKQNSVRSNIICFRIPNVIDSNGSVTNIFRAQIENNRPITITDKRMSRMFTTGQQAADEILYLLDNSVNKGVYVSTKKPIMIFDLAQNLIKDSGKEIPIEIVGIKPGEKLAEHSFQSADVFLTGIPFLGSLKNYFYDHELCNKYITKLLSIPSVAANHILKQDLLQYF